MSQRRIDITDECKQNARERLERHLDGVKVWDTPFRDAKEVLHDWLQELKDELGNERAFNEGWQDHIGDLLDAMKPFVEVLKSSKGNISVERLSFSDWHQLSRVFDAAVFALNLPANPDSEVRR